MIDKILRSATRRKLSARKENCSEKDDRVIGLIVASKRGSSRERESRCGGRALRSSDSAATVKRQGKGFQPLHASVNRSKEKEVKAMRVVTGRLTRSAVGLTEQGSSRPVRIRRKITKSEDEGKGGKASSAPSLLSNETVPPRRRGRPKKTPPPSLPPISASISSLKQRTSRSVPNGNREKRKILKFKGGRKREKAMESRDKWSLYRSRINKLLLLIDRESHFYEVFAFERLRADLAREEEKCRLKILRAKQEILDVFASIEKEGENYARYPALDSAGSEDEDVDLDSILCSICGKEDEPNNDILFCDGWGCCRAYHQFCLDPPLLTYNTSDDEEWFCQICSTLNSCLVRVNQVLYPGDGVDSWRRLFPELKVLAQDGEQCGDTMAGDDSEEDEDYCPPSSGRYDSHDGEDQLTSGDESDSGGSGVGEEEEDHDDNGLSLKDELVALRAESGEDSQDVVGGREGMSLRSFRGMDKKDGSLDGLAEDDPLSVIGRFVSKTIKGYLLRGQVLSYHPSQSSLPTPSSLALSSKRKVSAVKAPEPSSPLLNRDGVWKVQFEYESSPVFLNIQELKDGLKLYDEFVAKLPLQRSLRMREEKRTPHEEESTENVLLNTKRTRANVDYVALSMQLFGSTEESEADFAPYIPIERGGKEKTEIKRDAATRKQKIRKRTTTTGRRRSKVDER